MLSCNHFFPSALVTEDYIQKLLRFKAGPVANNTCLWTQITDLLEEFDLHLYFISTET